MTRKQSIFISSLCLAALAIAVPASRFVRSSWQSRSLPSAVELKKSSPAQVSLVSAYGKLPLTFEVNQGQTDARVKFLARGSGYTVFLADDESATFRLADATARSRRRDDTLPSKSNSAPPKPTDTVVRLSLAGSHLHAPVEGLDLQPGRSNYFLGNNPARWHRNVPQYARVKYRGVYPGIDLVYYGHQGQLESDYLLAPGANPGQIVLKVEGAESVKLDPQSGAILSVKSGDIRLHQPIAYQEIAGKRQEVAANYVQRAHNQIGIQVGPYDLSQPLVIDPVLAYATYLGGTANQFLFQVTADSSGFAYVAGFTSSSDFPTVAGSLNTKFTSGSSGMAFVTKLKQDGSGLVYSTFLGSLTSGASAAHAIALDTAGDAYVAGGTSSTDFPLMNPFQSINKGGGAFVSKLDPNGQTLLYSTYLTGTGSDSPNAIAVDASGKAYVAGTTSSKDLPIISSSAIQTTNKTTGAQIGTVFLSVIDPSLTSGATLVYSTYLGGTVQESALGVAVDANANAYLTGFTSSTDFPGPNGGSPNGFQSTLKDVNGAAFVARVNTTLSGSSGLTYSTYLSGSANGFGNAGDSGSAIALGPSGDAYITGISYATDFPLVGAIDTSSNTPFAKVIIARLDTTKSGTASLIYSTYFGGTLNMVGGTGHGSDLGFGIKVDPLGNIYLAGTTNSIDFPVTASAPQTKRVGIQNAFMSELNPAGSVVLFSTYLGGSLEAAYSIALDGATPANAFIAGTTAGNFPVTAGAFQTSDKVTGANNEDGFVAELSPGGVSGVFVTPPTLRFGNQVSKTTSSALTVALVNNTSAAITINSPGITILTSTNSSDFAISSNMCPAPGAKLAAMSSCTVGVTFTPSTTSSESATLSFADSDSTSPQQVLLSGTGTPAPLAVSVSPTSLNFGNQNLNTKSAAQTATLTNSGTTAVTINGTGISIIGANASDFAQMNTCPAVGSTLAAGANCTISVTFTPTVAGSRSATLNIEDSDSSSPQQVTLSGNGSVPGPPDFSLILTPTQSSVTAGGSANFSATVTSFNGFASAVSLSCTGAPVASTCTLSPTSVTPAANASASSSGTLTTKAFVLPIRLPGGPRPYPWIQLYAILGIALALLASRITRQRTSRKLVAAFALLLFAVLAACSGPNRSVSKTPAGTSTITVKGVSGTLSHSATFTLTVQ